MEGCMKRFSLENQVIIITGAAGLLGKMHTRAVLDAKGIPVMIDINEERLQKAADEIKEDYENCELTWFAADITKQEEMQSIRDALCEKYGRIDGLVNNACNNPTMKDTVSGLGRFETFTHDEWLQDMEVGLYGAVCCSQVFGTYMAGHGGGVILNIASDLGIIAPNQSLYRKEGEPEELQPKKPVTYSTVKWGLIGLTKYLSTYWADKNVRANAVAFGGVFNHQSEEFLGRVKELIPMGRMADQDEYMGSIVYLLSDASSYMTGSVVSIDGGRTAW